MEINYLIKELKEKNKKEKSRIVDTLKKVDAQELLDEIEFNEQEQVDINLSKCLRRLK